MTWTAQTLSTEAQISSETQAFTNLNEHSVFQEDMHCSDHKDGGRELLSTTRNHLSIDTVSYTRRLQYSAIDPCEQSYKDLSSNQQQKIWQDKRLLASQEDSDLWISLATRLKTKSFP
jgi:hypothetical protein